MIETQATADFSLKRDSFGRLVAIIKGGVEKVGVVPVRAFPISAPTAGFALLDAEGHELAWLSDLASLSRADREILEQALNAREFTPDIRRPLEVSSFATPSTWTVETDRGPTSFVLKGIEDIRPLTPPRLMVTDSHGVNYLIQSLNDLDRHSRKLLDRFL